MSDRNDILRRLARDDDDRVLLAYLIDRINTSENGSVASSYFLNEHQQSLANELAKEYELQNYKLWGGFYGAERRIAVYTPDWATEEPESYAPLTCIRASWPKSVTVRLSHRDFLGSLMGAGIKRETVGDILPGENYCDMVVLSSVAEFVLKNLVSVGRVNVHVEEVDALELIPALPEYKMIHDTVASLRLDSVVATGFALARDKAAMLVKSGRVNVNDIECDRVDRLIENGDIITARGFGKFRVSEAGRVTKKGRISIDIQKYI